MELVISGFEYVLDAYLPPLLIRTTICCSCIFVCCSLSMYFPFDVDANSSLAATNFPFAKTKNKNAPKEKISRLGLGRDSSPCSIVALFTDQPYKTGFAETVYGHTQAEWTFVVYINIDPAV